MTAILQSPWSLAKYVVEESILKIATLISILSPSCYPWSSVSTGAPPRP